MFCAQQTVNFNVEGAVRHKNFKNFCSRNRLKMKLQEFPVWINDKNLKKLLIGEDIYKLKKLTFAKLFW